MGKTISIRFNDEELKWLEEVKTSIYHDNIQNIKSKLTTSETIKCLIWNYWDEWCQTRCLKSDKSDSS